MKRPRIFAVLKWTGATACVLVVALAVASIWIRPLIGFPGGCVVVGIGNADVRWTAEESAVYEGYVTRLEVPIRTPRFRLSLPAVSKFRSQTPLGTHVVWRALIPLWLVLLVVAAPTVYLWWRDRRIPAGCCPNCGYDLTGNVSGRCPECCTLTGV